MTRSSNALTVDRRLTGRHVKQKHAGVTYEVMTENWVTLSNSWSDKNFRLRPRL